jgi:polyferredoxin
VRSGWRRCVCDARCESACECVRCVVCVCVCVGRSDLPTPPQELISIATQRSLQAGAHTRHTHTHTNVSSAQGDKVAPYGRSSRAAMCVPIEQHSRSFPHTHSRCVWSLHPVWTRPRTRRGVSHDTAGPPYQ